LGDKFSDPASLVAWSSQRQKATEGLGLREEVGVSLEVLAVYFLLLILIALGGKFILSPLQLLLKIALRGGAGLIFLVVFNLLSRFTGYDLPLNVYTALYCGYLGLPGIISLCFLKTWL